MKLPRDVSGDDAIKAFQRLGFSVVRQTGSHVRMKHGSTHITVPKHDCVAVGTLHSILRQSGLSLNEFVKAL
jgi:predicted RNA binding protein YcfA (HicA-like mRNA interferase family)